MRVHHLRRSSHGSATGLTTPGLTTPIWSVRITAERPAHDALPEIPANTCDRAATIGVDLEFLSNHIEASFLVTGDDIRDAAEAGFERWSEICRLLSLPNWPCSSTVITTLHAAADHDPDVREFAPGYRFPYYIWPAA